MSSSDLSHERPTGCTNARPGARCPTVGADVVLDLTGFHALLPGAALVVTGEGTLDERTLHGKAPSGVAAAGAGGGVPVVAVCGRSLLSPDDAARAGFRAVHTPTALDPERSRCMTNPAPLLHTIGTRLTP